MNQIVGVVFEKVNFRQTRNRVVTKAVKMRLIRHY